MLLGKYINHVKLFRQNPFEQFTQDGINFSTIVKCYDPDVDDHYTDIQNNIEKWIKEAIDISVTYIFPHEYVE